MIIRERSFMQIFKFLKRREKTNFELNYPKHAVTMVTDFQRKSSKLQCSGEHCQCVH